MIGLRELVKVVRTLRGVLSSFSISPFFQWLRKLDNAEAVRLRVPNATILRIGDMVGYYDSLEKREKIQRCCWCWTREVMRFGWRETERAIVSLSTNCASQTSKGRSFAFSGFLISFDFPRIPGDISVS